MSVRVVDGWLRVPFSGYELAQVHIAVGAEPTDWRPAFLSWDSGRRVAQIRPPVGVGMVSVWLRVGSAVTAMGRLAL